MATVIIQKRRGKKKISYQVYYKETLSGERKYYKSYPRQREAQKAANDLRILLDSGKLPEKKPLKLQLMTVERVCESLKMEWDRRLSEGTLSKKTHEDYCYWLNVLIRKYKGRLLCQLTNKEIRDFLHEQLSRNSKVSSNKYLLIFKKVFQHGLGLNALFVNPIEEIKGLSEKEHERKRFILPHELDRLVEAALNNRGKFYLPAIIYLGAEHSAAKQEILDLQWSDIDFDFAGRGLIRFFRTKNTKERVEFLMPRTKKALLSWRDHLEWKRKKERIAEPKSNHVFCRIDGTPIKRFDKAWWASLKGAGIRNFRFHDLRHTFASNMLLSGASLKDVKEMMGHKDISMTDRYSHLTLTHLLQKQNQLADYYLNGGVSLITRVGNK